MRKVPKYRAKPTEVDGIRFASKREANRYAELKLLERGRQIFHLLLQPVFDLEAPHAAVPGELVRVGKYVADFAYVLPDRSSVVEDVKGFRTPLYRWKKRHAEIQYGIVIREI